MAGKIVHLGLQTFDDVVEKADFILVDFWANWCGPCKMLAPVIEELVEDEDILVGKVDVDDCEEIARRYGIMSIPTLMIFKKGQNVAKDVGYKNITQLKNFVAENK